MEDILLGIACACFMLAVLSVVAAGFIFVKLDVPDAVRFLRHGSLKAWRKTEAKGREKPHTAHTTGGHRSSSEPDSFSTAVLNGENTEEPTCVLAVYEGESEQPTIVLEEAMGSEDDRGSSATEILRSTFRFAIKTKVISVNTAEEIEGRES